MIEASVITSLIYFGKIYIIGLLIYLTIKSLINGMMGTNNTTDDWWEAVVWPFTVANLVGQLISLIWRK